MSANGTAIAHANFLSSRTVLLIVLISSIIIGLC